MPRKPLCPSPFPCLSPVSGQTPPPPPPLGAVWLSNPEDIIAQASHIPGLLEAVFALGQRAFTTFSPHAHARAWAPHLPPTGDPVLVDITLLPSGMALGQHDPAYSMDAELDDLIAAIEADEPTCTSFDTGMLVCLALPVPRALSAHARCALPTTAARLLAEWKRALPGWMEGWADDLTLAFAPPDADAIGTALSRFSTEPL